MRIPIITPIAVESFDMVRGAKVEVRASNAVATGAGRRPYPVATIVVNDKYEHEFSANSRVSKALWLMTPEQLQERLNGGAYFFINGKLIDFRYAQDVEFVHSDESIGKMIELIGVRSLDANQRRSLGIKTHDTDSALSGYYSNQEIILPQYMEGGNFEARLMYNWNPFHSNIKGVFELFRLICKNGMVGMADFMNTQIPVINRWEESLEIASHTIQRQVEGRVTNRLRQMDKEPASVAELQSLADHALSRSTQSSDIPQEERTRLSNLYSVLNPVLHLSRYYKKNVFEDRNVAAQMPGHVSTMTLFNAATEMATHTRETDASSTFALQRFANDLLFNLRNKREKLLERAKGAVRSLSSPFENPTQAFVGKVSE